MRVTLTILMATLAMTAATLRADEPTSVDDPAFDVHCPAELIGRAWRELDPALMADCALLLEHGEAILERPRRGISAEQAHKLAVRLAVQQGDIASLERLAKAADRRGNKQLAAVVEASIQLAAASRDGDSEIRVSIDHIHPTEFAMLQGVSRRLRELELVGTAEDLEELERQIAELHGLTKEQKQRLEQIMGRSRAAMPKEAVVEAKVYATLQQLAHPPRYEDLDENEIAVPPTEIAGGRDFPQN